MAAATATRRSCAAPAAGRKRTDTVVRSLERRLLTLTSGLDSADVAEKGIDVVKEIRELHALLRSLHENADGAAPPPPLEVRWLEQPPPAAASEPSAAPPET